MNADKIVREARGLHTDWVVFESMHHGGGQGAKSDDGEAKRKFMLWLVDDFPVMCDLIESMQAQVDEMAILSHAADKIIAKQNREIESLQAQHEQAALNYQQKCRDVVELEAQLSASQRRAQDARNELCLKCGRYREAHKGACDGCRWMA